MWFLAKSGDTGAQHFRRLSILEGESDQKVARADTRRMQSEEKKEEALAQTNALLRSLKLVDGFLSQRQPEEAQRVTRLALASHSIIIAKAKT